MSRVCRVAGVRQPITDCHVYIVELSAEECLVVHFRRNDEAGAAVIVDRIEDVDVWLNGQHRAGEASCVEQAQEE